MGLRVSWWQSRVVGPLSLSSCCVATVASSSGWGGALAAEKPCYELPDLAECSYVMLPAVVGNQIVWLGQHSCYLSVRESGNLMGPAESG